MLTDDFNFDLPQGLIAQRPVKPRDHSRLLVVHRAMGRFSIIDLQICLTFYVHQIF